MYHTRILHGCQVGRNDHKSTETTTFCLAINVPHDFIIYEDMSKEDNINFSIKKVKDRLEGIFNDPRLSELNAKPREHYLSPVWIEEKCRFKDKNMTGAISKKYITMEAFREAVKGPNERTTSRNATTAANDLSAWRVTPDVIRSVLNAVTSLLEGGQA